MTPEERAGLISELRAEVAEISNKLALLAAEQPVEPSETIVVTPPPAPPPVVLAANPGFAAEGAFYDFLRDNNLLGPKISATEFKGCDAITRAAAQARWPISFTAYALGTAYLETAHQMVPVREAFWLSASAAAAYFHRMYDPDGQRPDVARRLGNTHTGDGALFCGRGYPQLTGRANYAKASEALGVDLVANPGRALEPEIASQVMIWGMATGAFTGHKLADYLPTSGLATLEQFTPARHIINGTDRASDVAGFALDFQRGLEAGKWQF